MLLLAGISAACVAVFVVVVALGDQRQFDVVTFSPTEGETVSATVQFVSVTFSSEPRREAVEAAFRIEPEVRGVPRWRGRTFEYVLREPLRAGSYEVTLDRGTLGSASEELREAVAFTFSVREPGVAVILREPGLERLVEMRDGAEPRELARGPRILDYSIAPDGRQVGIVIANEPSGTRLELLDPTTGESQVVVDTPEIEVASVAWAADSQALLVVRRDRLPGGEFGVPRAWLLRTSGEFVTPIDPEGEPSLAPTWSPDSQAIAYVAPATGQLVVFNLSTQEEVNLGQPRSPLFAWSPNSRMIVFESVPAVEGSNPPQPIRVKSVDDSVDRSFGEAGETRSQGQFLNDQTVLSLRRTVGTGGRGTELLFESIEEGNLQRSVLLAPRTDIVLGYDLDPSLTEVVYTVQAGATVSTIVLSLENGERTLMPEAGTRPQWMP